MRRQWLSHVTGPVVIDGNHFYPIQQARSFYADCPPFSPRIFCNDRVAKTAQYFRKVTHEFFL